MVESQIKTLAQSLEISDVYDVVVTSIGQDEVRGDYVREIRIVGQPEHEGGEGPVVVTLRLRSADPTAVYIEVPKSEF